jgi:type IV pilus assembly protein PilA
MFRSQKGFTLIELMIVVVIIGILAAIAIPNFIAMQNRAKEGSTKANMHTMQLAAEDYGVQNDGVYSATMDATHIADLLPGGGTNFKNPFTGNTGSGSGGAWDATGRAFVAPAPATSGMSSYGDSATAQYNIKGYGKTAALSLVLTSGQ